MLNDGDRQAVDDEHHIRPVAFSGRRLELPLPGDVEDVGCGPLEIDQTNLPVPLFGFVVPLPLAAQPSQHLAIALDGRRYRFQSFHGGANGIFRHPGIELLEGPLEFATEQHSGLAAALLHRVHRRERGPADLRCVADHGELDCPGFGDSKMAHDRLSA